MDNSKAATIGLIVLAAVVSILLFFIVRAIICWYFKINKRVFLLEEQNELLKDILEKLEAKN